MQVCCAMTNPSVSDNGTGQEDLKVSRGEASSRVFVPLATEWMIDHERWTLFDGVD